MTEQELDEVLTNYESRYGGRIRTHNPECWKWADHAECTVPRLVAEVRRQRQEIDRLREALTWAVGFIRCQHPNAYLEYEDMRNACSLVDGKTALWSGEFQRVSARAEVAEYDRDQLKKLLPQHGIQPPEST